MVHTQLDDPAMLKITRLLDATPQEVFEAWTDPENVKQWMCPGDASVPVVELDVRVGGTFRVDMQDENGTYIHTGIYREIKPPEKLVFTWISENTHHQETLVTVELFERGDKTELVLTQVQLPDEAAIRRHTSGWTKIVEHLANYINDRNGKSI